MDTTSVPVIDFIVLGGFVVLLILAGVQLAVIWVHRTPLFRWQELSSGARARWLAAMIILGIGLILNGFFLLLRLPEIQYLWEAADAEAFAFELGFALYLLGGFSFLLLAFLTALWRPVRAALVVAVAAVYVPVLTLIPFSAASGPGSEDYLMGASFTAITYSAPALLVAFLLWSWPVTNTSGKTAASPSLS
jgi:hypothetical protein